MKSRSPEYYRRKARHQVGESCVTILFAIFIATLVALLIGWNLNLREENWRLNSLNDELISTCFEPVEVSFNN